MNTLLLDSAAWDLTTDKFGNIALATDGYALAQDAASAIRTVQGEVYYDTTLGIPYFQQILGFSPPVSLMKAYFVQAALAVPEVATAVCFIASIINRQVSGQVQVRTAAGQLAAANFVQSPVVTELETA
jgi:hypothetical protein